MIITLHNIYKDNISIQVPWTTCWIRHTEVTLLYNPTLTHAHTKRRKKKEAANIFFLRVTLRYYTVSTTRSATKHISFNTFYATRAYNTTLKLKERREWLNAISYVSMNGKTLKKRTCLHAITIRESVRGAERLLPSTLSWYTIK